MQLSPNPKCQTRLLVVVRIGLLSALSPEPAPCAEGPGLASAAASPGPSDRCADARGDPPPPDRVGVEGPGLASTDANPKPKRSTARRWRGIADPRGDWRAPFPETYEEGVEIICACVRKLIDTYGVDELERVAECTHVVG